MNSSPAAGDPSLDSGPLPDSGTLSDADAGAASPTGRPLAGSGDDDQTGDIADDGYQPV